MLLINDVQQIERYEAPQYLVKPVCYGHDIAGEVTTLESVQSEYARGNTEIIEWQIAGWGPYNAIVRVTPSDSEDTCDYLAQFIRTQDETNG